METLQDFYQHLGFDPATCPDAVRAFPSMMHKDEKTLLYALARHHYRGFGAIVDTGLFLGASTHAFCTGIKDGHFYELLLKTGQKPVQAYDIALWDSGGFDKYLEIEEVRAHVGDTRYANGESYLPLLRHLLREHLELIDFRIGDIVKEIRADKPVEIAFFDCLKNYERDWAAFKALGPHYVPGHTIIVQQDYFFEGALDNKIRQELIGPYCRFLGGCATSAVFKLEQKLPDEYFTDDPLPKLSPAERVELLKSAARRIPVSAFQLYAELGVVSELINTKNLAEAAEYLDQIDSVIAMTPLPPRPKDVAALLRKRLGA
jgi:hypothetical protein